MGAAASNANPSGGLGAIGVAEERPERGVSPFPVAIRETISAPPATAPDSVVRPAPPAGPIKGQGAGGGAVPAIGSGAPDAGRSISNHTLTPSPVRSTPQRCATTSTIRRPQPPARSWLGGGSWL